MSEKIIYLDSSVIVKRYVKEPFSNRVRECYLQVYSGDVVLSFSTWNIGEVLGVFDRARRVGRIDEDTYNTVKKRFLLELRRLIKLKRIILIPIKMKILVDSWKLIEKYHIYQADALQIASAKEANATEFLTADKVVHRVAVKENIKSKCLS